VLDLDETLIHSDISETCPFRDTYISIPDGLFRKKESVGLNIRPHLKEFLEFTKKNFEVILMTSSVREYADAVVDYIDPKNQYFDFRVYRKNCLTLKTQKGTFLYIKDISIFNRNIKDIVIVDNSIISFSNQLDNGILVPSFCHGKEDNTLLCLKDYLKDEILPCEDIREVNRKNFGFEELKNKLKMNKLL
jgi:Dullard-like phosphatase family protein